MAIQLDQLKNICIVGGGTTGWFAALQMRHIYNNTVNITVIADPETPIIGVGEGGILNLMEALFRFNIPFMEFLKETHAVHKLGFVYEGWRNNTEDDCYYHMFPKADNIIIDSVKNFYPLLSVLVNHGIPISNIVDSIKLRELKVSQEYITNLFVNDKNKNFLSSFHFDTYKVGQFLKKIALQRNVKYISNHVKDVEFNSLTGQAEYLICNDNSKIQCDFVVDATGFSRQLINKLNGNWHTLQDRLIMNRALPFHLELQGEPDLVTRSTAMNSGWIWQIPVKDRIGAGYVFNDAFLTEDQAILEIEGWLGCKINPNKLIKFEAGYYKNIWNKNILAIGLASGFVEPLEATSIGQMLMQLKLFETLVKENSGIISEYHIQYYNEQNAKSWEGIGDFIRMHYDTTRQDTPFWKAMPSVKMSDYYQELKSIWQYRSPRHLDFLPYEMHGMLHFDVYSWLAIAQAMGIVKPEVVVPEIMGLTPEIRRSLANSLQEIHQRINTPLRS